MSYRDNREHRAAGVRCVRVAALCTCRRCVADTSSDSVTRSRGMMRPLCDCQTVSVWVVDITPLSSCTPGPVCFQTCTTSPPKYILEVDSF
jgi:hypothetical protein